LFKQGNFGEQIQKIDGANEIFYVYFKDEATTKTVFTWLEEYRDSKVKMSTLMI
jgi:hypothetical protein